MWQILQAIDANPSDKTKVTLVFSNQTEEDILLRKEFEGEFILSSLSLLNVRILRVWKADINSIPFNLVFSEIQSRKPDQFNIVFTLDKPPKNWKGETGYVNAEVLKKSLEKFGTTADKGNKVKVFVCKFFLSFFSNRFSRTLETRRCVLIASLVLLLINRRTSSSSKCSVFSETESSSLRSS